MREIDRLLVNSGKFYLHIDGSLCCKKCALTLDEGCRCWDIVVKKRKV